jgi:inhibitor of KinA
MSHPAYHIYYLGQSSAVIDLGNIIDENLNNKVLAMEVWLRQHLVEGIKDIVIAYSSLTVLYDPFIIYNRYAARPTAFEFVKKKLEEAYDAADEFAVEQGKEVSIPVCYDPEFGYDIRLIAAAKQMKVDELISLHCSKPYRVYMIGFLPGFAYMGKVDPRLALPRKAQPREVEAGSVGLAGWQTGIYPLQSPGGWQIIGRTPLKLFDASTESLALLSAGDTVRFYSISREEYEAINSKLQAASLVT